MSHYQRHLRKHPDDAALWVQLGHMQKTLGRLSAAATAYQRALYLRPHDADTYLHLGHLHKLRREMPLAMSAWRRALELEPSFSLASEELQRLAGEFEDPEDRVSALEARVARMERRISSLEYLNGVAAESSVAVPSRKA